jgi:hypothetical protein
MEDGLEKQLATPHHRIEARLSEYPAYKYDLEVTPHRWKYTRDVDNTVAWKN